MSLAPGTRLGAYEVIGLIGAGGMGEVYRARDTRLKREVAIKILPEIFAADTERIARFQREAEVLASLNHPNIAHIHGLEDAGSYRALVLELVDGPTLADRIVHGPIPLDEALPIARQIAEALEAAHEHGIVHRDLKPANIKLREDGTVKVLDFGLAKALSTDASAANVSMSPTITSPAMVTGGGIILGTAAFMSPEQARGKAVDKRTDIWAFGCVLYEMLTSKRAFEGENVSEVLARILEREPDFGALPQTTPTAIRRLLRRSLEKDRRRRLQDIGDARIEMNEALAAPAEETLPATVQQPRPRWRPAAMFGAALLIVVAIVLAIYVRGGAPDPVVTRLEISTPGTQYPFQFALSPDGRQLAFVAGPGASQLWVRSLDQVNAHALAGTEGARYPFWSPDSRAIGFFADSRLKRIDLSGGAPQALADTPSSGAPGDVSGGTWNAEGVIVVAVNNGSGLMRVAATGGTPVAVTRLAPGQTRHLWPEFLPDGRQVLFLAQGQPQTSGVYVTSFDGGEPTRVVASATAASYASGYLLRVSQGVLVAQHFDPQRAAVSGDPIPVAQSVGENDVFRSAFSISPAGILAHRSTVAVPRQLSWLDRTGKILGTVGPPDENTSTSPELAPDGQRVATGRLRGNADVWLIDVAREIATRFTFDPAGDFSPVWSPDGTRVAFRSTRKTGVADLFVKPANGAADEQPLLVTPQPKTPLSWSRDGRFLLYANLDPKTLSDLWALPLTAEKKPFPVVQTAFDEKEGQFSPDERWLAYTSNESGRDEVYIRSFPAVVGKWQVSTGSGSQPRWRSDGKELFYVSADARLMAVPIRVTPDGRGVDSGVPAALFSTDQLARGNPAGYLSRAMYAVASDGRFLMNMNIDTADIAPLTVVLNWEASLKK